MSRGRSDNSQVASSVPFDNTGTEFEAEDVQAAIEEVGVSASPGFSFGRSGNLSNNTWLRRPGNVPSNRAGITIPVQNPVIKRIACSNRNIDTYDVLIYEHEGNSVNLTLLTTVTVVAARGDIFDVDIQATEGKQLAVRLGNSGSVRDLGVDIILKGNA